MTDRTYKSRVIVTEGAVYEQRAAGTSNTGSTLTEVRRTGFMENAHPHVGYRVRALNEPWLLLEPAQGEPYVGDRWTLRYAHSKHIRTDVVNEIIGDL